MLENLTMEETPRAATENVFQIVQELGRSSQVTIEAFQHHLQFIRNLQQQTLEDVGVIQSEIADILNQSIREIKQFRNSLLSAQRTTAVLGENVSIDTINSVEKSQSTDIKEKDCVGKLSLQDFSSMATSQLRTLDLDGPSLYSGQISPINTETQQNYILQFTDTDNCEAEKSFVSFKSKEVSLGENKKQDSNTQHANRTGEAETENFDMVDSIFNVSGSGPLSSTMLITEYEDIEHGDPLCVTDLIQTRKHTHPSLEHEERGTTLEKTDNKNTTEKGNLDKLFKSINEEIAGSQTNNPTLKYTFKIQELKSFLSEADQVEFPNQDESEPLEKALRQLHTNAQFLRSENLQCREQINRLRTDKTFLHIQLSKAEQDTEMYRQQAKVMNDKCEELFKQRKQIQDERNYLCFEKQLLMKEIELLKEENKTFLKDLSAAVIEKEGLIKKLDSSKKTALSYAREKQEIHSKLNETLMENYRLRRKADESRTQHLKKTQEYL
ncbi:coiled-coil domain-containing protein 110 [Pyxicephalus adspersus]